jgi:hypothetical protein
MPATALKLVHDVDAASVHHAHHIAAPSQRDLPNPRAPDV